ncbi:MAG: hypothetical protein JXR96_01045 [Deltaproteobacteria bacterium]|nr:hypothetical protein [Deltaproteobacteria bacterium]
MTRMQRGQLGWACLLAGLLVAGFGCDETRFRTVKTNYDLFFPEGDVQRDSFVQKAAAKIDILWVVDNSRSMQEEQDNLAGNFDEFIGIIESSQVDYQIGVTSTDMDTHGGRLQGNPKIIVPGPDAETYFRNNIHVGMAGAGDEQGIMAAYMALSEPLISTDNAGFLRADAALAMIFVSDEDDHSFGKISFYRRFFEQIKTVGNENRVMAAAIVGDQPDGCSNPQTGQAAAGTRYHMLAQQVGGNIGSICSEDFGQTLTEMGLTVAGLDRKFFLSDSNPDADSIEVRVGGELIDQDWETGWFFEDGAISFNGSYVPLPGETIEVSYKHPQREFILSQTPAYDPADPEDMITVIVYPPGANDCSSSDECGGGACGLAGKCGGQVIPYSLASGWVIETRTIGDEDQYIVAFERDYYPDGGSVVQVEYPCLGGCQIR